MFQEPPAINTLEIFLEKLVEDTEPGNPETLHKKRNFILGVSAVNVIKSARNCGFGHIY